MKLVPIIDIIKKDAVSMPIEEKLGVEVLAAVIMDFDSDNTDEYAKMVSAIYGIGSYSYALKKLYLDLKNRDTPPI